MIPVLFVVNAILLLPFGVMALIMPEGVFAQFGVTLDPAGALIARGYAATSVGYGLALLLARRTTDPDVIRGFLVSMVVFNAIEAIIQGAAGMQGLAQPVIYGNVAVHGAAALWAAVLLLKRRG